jgi:hypothetical protein
MASMIVPGLIAGALSILTSWLWMGVIFHRFQNLTPGTWRRETTLSYVVSSAIHMLTAITIAIFFSVLKQHAPNFLGTGLQHVIGFAFVVWAVFAVPIILDTAIFVRLHPMVVVGQLFDWLTVSLLATLITAWWQHA